MKRWTRRIGQDDLAQCWCMAEGPVAETGAMLVDIEAELAESGAVPLMARAVAPAGTALPGCIAGAALALLHPYHAVGASCAIVVHAVQGGAVEPVAGGRLWRTGAGALLGVQTVAAPAEETGYAAAIDAVALALATHGGWGAVARTWWWLDRILDVYPDFNRARTARFAKYGLIASDDTRRLPASTGIGLRPAVGAALVEALAVPGRRAEPLERTARQHAASRYGSSFARAVRVATPTGPMLLVSGTASIDTQGATLHPGDRAAQARETVACLRAVLAEARADEAGIVSGLAYASDAAAATAWREAAPDWPVPLVPAVICRPDLLVECELTVALPRPA